MEENRRSGPDPKKCQRWRRFLENAAKAFKMNIVVSAAEKTERFSACDQCTACESALKPFNSPSVLERDAEDAERQTGYYDMLRLDDAYSAAVQSCTCRHTGCALETAERTRIIKSLLLEIWGLIREPFIVGRSAAPIDSLHYFNSVILQLFPHDEDVLERALGLTLSIAALLLSAEECRLEFAAMGRLFSASTNGGPAREQDAACTRRTLSVEIHNTMGIGTISIISPADLTMADVFLDFIVEECTLLIETAGLLKTASSQLLPVLNAVGAAVMLVGRRQDICYANQAAARLLGRPIQEILSMPVSEIDAPWRCCFTSAEAQTTRGMKDRLMCGDAEKLVDWEVLPVPGQAQATGWFIIAEDCTDSYRLEELGEKTENLVQASTLLKVIAHEIRNPLATFKGLLQIIDLKSGSPEIRKYVNIGLNEVKKISLLLDEFSRFGKAAAVNLEATDLKAFMEEVLILVNTGFSGPGIEITAAIDDVKPVLADRRQLTQAIFNLVKNAYEALEHRGRITLRLSQRDEDWAEITVSDNGPGISDSIKDKLFKPYFSTKKEGTGLGLAIALSIVSNHGGTISVRNQEDGGACFSILLPVCLPKNENLPDGTDVLLVTGSERLRLMSERLLKTSGLTFYSLNGGDSVNRVVGEHKPRAVMIDDAYLNLNILQKMLRNLTNDYPDMKIIVAGDRALKSDGILQIPKHLLQERLIEAIRMVLI